MSCSRLSQRGKVVRLDGSGAHILFDSLGGCAACAAGHGCGLATFAALFAGGDRAVLRVAVVAPLELAVGDAVRVSLNARRLLQLVIATYIGPLIGICVGAFGVAMLLPASGDVGALSGAALGGLLAGGLLFASARRRRSLTWLDAQITRDDVA